MTKKIEPWKRYSEDEYLETIYEYQCPDCNQVIWITNHPVVEEYNYCPRCGKKRIEDAEKDGMVAEDIIRNRRQLLWPALSMPGLQ